MSDETGTDPFRVNPDGLDGSLAKWRALNWVVETFDGEPRKIPKRPDNPARNAKSNDGSTWGSFDTALTNARENDDLGFGFPCAQSGSPFVFIDVDIPDGDEWVPPFDHLGGAIVERSPSGTSRRIVLTGCEVPEWWSNQAEKNDDDETREVKVFDSTGYVTLTGDTIDGFGTPLEPTHSPALERWLKEAWITFNDVDEPRPWDDAEEQDGPTDPNPRSNAGENGGRTGDEWIDADTAAEALEHIDPDLPNDEWVRIGFALGGHFPTGTAERLFEQWSRGGSKWDAQAERRVSSIVGDADGSVGIGSLVYQAKLGGWDASAAAREANTNAPAAADGGTAVETAVETTIPAGEQNEGTDVGTFATVPSEPVVDENDRVSIVQAVDGGRGVNTVPLGRLQCKACGTVVGEHIKRGEAIDVPNSCPGCEKQAGFEPLGADGEADPDIPLNTYLDPPWYTPGGIEDDRLDELWDDTREYIREHWDAGEEHEHLYDGLTAYAMTTWLRPDLEFLPHLMLMGRFTGGKTRLLNTLARVSYRALVTASATPASMFRLIDNYDVTFFVSEYHGLDPDTRRDLDAIIRAAQKRGEKVTRADPALQGQGGFTPSVFDPFTHVAVATQYEPADDIISRCVQVRTSPATRDMPATHDEERAVDIRSRLLYARLLYLDSDEFETAERSAYGYLAQKGIDGRPREKLLALLTVAELWDRTEEIKPFVDELVQATADAEADSADARFVEAVRDLAFEEIGQSIHDSDTDPFAFVEIPLRDVAERYNDMTGEERSASWVGHVRARLGIDKARKRDGTVLTDDRLREKLERLCEDYGLAWESLDVHDPVADLSQHDQLKHTCGECGELKWLAHKHVVEGYYLCDECAEEVREAER